MNEILHHQIVIELDVWSAWKKEAEMEIYDLIAKIKEKKLLAHCGNVKSIVSQTGRQIV